MFEILKDFIFPKLCFCGSPVDDEDSLCPECWQKLDVITNNFCPKCGFPHEHDFGTSTLCSSCISKEPDFDKARSVFKYNDFSGGLITSLKYADKTHLIEMLSKFLASEIRKIGSSLEEYDIITSVPINRMRMIKRKYNQSALLANRVGRELNIKVNNMLLHRVKNVPPQTGLRRKERLKNVKGVFEVPKKYEKDVKDMRVIIIDDVYTTGATLNECARTLKKVGVSEVFCVTLARTMLN